MKSPRYQPSRLTAGLQHRIFLALVVVLLAMVSGFLFYPFYLKRQHLARLASPDPAIRVRALNHVARLAVKDPPLADVVASQLVELLGHDQSGVRAAAVAIGGWTIGHIDHMRGRLEDRLDDAADRAFSGMAAALREGGVWDTPDRGLHQRCRWAALRCRGEDSSLLVGALDELCSLGPACEDRLEPVLRPLLTHTSAAVREAAVVAASVCLPRSRVPLLRRAAADADDRVGTEARARLELLVDTGDLHRPPRVDPVPAIEILESTDYHARIEVLDRLSGHPPGPVANQAAWVTAVRRVVGEGLRSGNGGLAGQALLALARLGDTAYLTVMLDVAAGTADQPMLRFMAARAAARLDADSGGQALINLFGQDVDAVRDLAAVELARIDHPAVAARLRSELFSSDVQVRGPAALALVLAGVGQTRARGMTLEQLLLKRTLEAPGNVHAELDWKPRGYYLCARLILGDDGVRPDLQLFLLNEHFPRLAIYTALLHSGEMSVVDMLLGTDPARASELAGLLRDQRFGDILSRYVPEAPIVRWGTSPQACIAQIARLIRWWSMYRTQLVFDREAQVYRMRQKASRLGA